MAIEFGARGNGRAYTGEGWSTPEDTETWSVGEQCRLALPRPDQPACHVLWLELRPHVVPGKLAAQRLGVSVNGHAVAQFSLPRRSVRACRIPWPVLAERPTVDIVLSTPDAARPADLGWTPDTRRLGVALSRLRFFADVHPAGGPAGNEPVPVDVSAIMMADRLSVADLMLRFESLGQNCEFGLVQRRCKAEPLGLLRFSSTPLPKLLVALEARFEGFGAPESLRVELSPNGREYMINDSRFGFLYHAFVDSGAMGAEELHRREARRVPFLVNKLLEDLVSGEKIFVFKGMGAMAEEEVFPLAMELRRYGPNTLLFVNLAGEGRPGGSVEVRSPGFMVGYLDRFAPSEDADDFELAQWVRACRGACRFRLAEAGA